MRSLTIIRSEVANDVKILAVADEEPYADYPETITIQGICYQKICWLKGEILYCS